MKCSGKEFKAFWWDTGYWATGVYMNDAIIKINGVTTEYFPRNEIADDDVISLIGGSVFCHQKRIPSVGFFKKWRNNGALK